MPYIDIGDLITKQLDSDIDYEVKMRHSGWGYVVDEMSDRPTERISEIGRETTCQMCGAVFIAKKNTAMFCSRGCEKLQHSRVKYNGKFMKKLEKFALVYLECNRDIAKATKEMGYNSIGGGRKSLALAKREGLL